MVFYHLAQLDAALFRPDLDFNLLNKNIILYRNLIQNGKSYSQATFKE